MSMLSEINYCSKKLTKLLLDKKCPLHKVVVADNPNIYYTKPYDDPEWCECDAYYIPTHAEIIQWLIEQYDILISIIPTMADDIDYNKCLFSADVFNISQHKPIRLNYFSIIGNTYYETTEKILKYVIENFVH